MDNKVVELGEILGFTCQKNMAGKWLIFSLTENWQLTEVEEKWELSIKETPQINLNEIDAIAFLK
ncbi:MAG: hypothetical protein DSM107014_07975 [Gomphosphaeria aponina SAG 52.96 = DSM 107014]|uniref:Uncharacterized protein n=1 Tax=Gomphosphaeria aponina SAG 52.96 = DSM 107014 TaxID=1521640 RepID=A0A941GXT3_9CHRO|nr:hypothetical protein [Gomphosphaeria aponina SAG 52.96 = DSM 107014]